MEFIRKTLAQVGQHLSGLTISQRLAIGLCVVLMAVAVVWLLQWSARPEMVPVVFEGFSPDQLQGLRRDRPDIGNTTGAFGSI